MNIAIILSGGTGSRVGTEIPKQYIKLKGKTILAYTMESIFNCRQVDGVVIAAADEYQSLIREEIEKNVPETKDKFLAFSPSGVTRQMSIYNALLKIKEKNLEAVKVLIHDAARPMVSEKTLEACFNVLKKHDGAMPVLPMKDTVYESTDGKRVTGLLKRENIFAGQSPESYDFEKYLKANEALLPDKILTIKGSTEPAVMAGMSIALLEGDESNFKITTKSDLVRFEKIVDKW